MEKKKSDAEDPHVIRKKLAEFKSDAYTFQNIGDFVDTLQKGPLRVPAWVFAEFTVRRETCAHLSTWTSDAYERVKQVIKIVSSTPRAEWPCHVTYSELLKLYACAKYENIPGLTEEMMNAFGFRSSKELEAACINYRDEADKTRDEWHILYLGSTLGKQ